MYALSVTGASTRSGLAVPTRPPFTVDVSHGRWRVGVSPKEATRILTLVDVVDVEYYKVSHLSNYR